MQIDHTSFYKFRPPNVIQKNLYVKKHTCYIKL